MTFKNSSQVCSSTGSPHASPVLSSNLCIASFAGQRRGLQLELWAAATFLPGEDGPKLRLQRTRNYGSEGLFVEFECDGLSKFGFEGLESGNLCVEEQSATSSHDEA